MAVSSPVSGGSGGRPSASAFIARTMRRAAKEFQRVGRMPVFSFHSSHSKNVMKSGSSSNAQASESRRVFVPFDESICPPTYVLSCPMPTFIARNLPLNSGSA